MAFKTLSPAAGSNYSEISLERGFGLGFGVDGVKELRSPDLDQQENSTGEVLLHSISHHPKEQMVVIFMPQLHPTGGLILDRQVSALAYQAIAD